MPFKALGDWSQIAGLELPYDDTDRQVSKIYRIPPVDAELGPKCQAIVEKTMAALRAQMVAKARGEPAPVVDDATGGTELLSDDEEREFYPRLLGPAFGEMTADGVPWSFVQHAAATTMFDAAMGREAAEQFWETRDLGKADTVVTNLPNRSDRRASARRTSSGSTAGTTSRPAKPATRSPGRRSSSSGT